MGFIMTSGLLYNHSNHQGKVAIDNMEKNRNGYSNKTLLVEASVLDLSPGQQFTSWWTRVLVWNIIKEQTLPHLQLANYFYYQ
jgi:hypothetical protein